VSRSRTKGQYIAVEMYIFKGNRVLASNLIVCRKCSCCLQIQHGTVALLNVPLLRSRAPLTLKVLPLTSTSPEEPRVRPPEKDRVPPVEVMDADVSDNACPRVKFTFFVSMAELALSMVSVFGSVSPALPVPRVSLLPPRSSVPKVILSLLVISVLPLNLKAVFAPVVN